MSGLPTRDLVSRLLINRSFGLLWSGQTVSYLGDAVFTTTLVLWIATRLAQGLSWAPLAVSGVLLASSGATLLVGPLAGVFVDRWDKRRTLLAMDALRACLMAPLLFTFGVQWALLIDALSFGASFLAILSMDTPPPARSVTPETSGNALNEFLTGLRFFAGNRVLMAMGERRIAPTNRGRNLYVSV